MNFGTRLKDNAWKNRHFGEESVSHSAGQLFCHNFVLSLKLI